MMAPLSPSSSSQTERLMKSKVSFSPIAASSSSAAASSAAATTSTTSVRRGSSSQYWVLTITVAALVMLLGLRTQDMNAFLEQAEDREAVTAVPRQPSSLQQDNEEQPQNPIRQISILGERNSGTRWTFEHMSECFSHAVTVKKELTRYKHWFQYDDPTRYPHDTLVLGQFRNPYDWLMAMQHVPHHSPAHLSTETDHDWKVFLTKPWTMERIGSDLWPNRTTTATPVDAPAKRCQEDFLYRDIISCDIEPLPHEAYNHTIRYSEHQPFYEMRNDGSGLPYDNLLEMRTDKIRNFLSTANYKGVADLWVIQYEYLVHQGTAQLLKRIQEYTGIEPKCEPKPPQVRVPKKSRILPVDMAKHIRLNLNWTVEQWVGFEPELKREDSDWGW